MNASYKKLWKLMIDRDMSKTDLRLAIGASSATVAKLTNGEYVAGDVLARICKLFHCDIGDIMTLNVEDESAKGGQHGESES